ncbi:MAG: site-2 protease family protein [Methanosarcinales archaeon]|nr:site-2 protease family protein [Methanosarcinales archaeon]
MQTTTQLLILAFFIYWAIVYWLKKRGTLAKYNISAFGPILMIETSRGLDLVDKIARPKRFWRLFANIGIVLMFAGMIFMFSLIVLSDIALIRMILSGTVMEPNEYTEIQNIFLIPGVNQFIPLVWGAIALIIAIFIHEMMHSVLARVEDVKVHSVGVIAALFPIGGFAKIDTDQLYGDELDILDKPKSEAESGYNSFDDLTASIEEIREHERLKMEQAAHEKESAEKMQAAAERKSEKFEKKTKEGAKAATKTQRSRILAAGVMSNFVVALIAAALFFGPVVGAMSPIGTLQIMDLDNSAVSSGLTKEMILIDINGQKVTNAEDVNRALADVTPGEYVTVRASFDRIAENFTILTSAPAENINYAGILVSAVQPGSPAEAAGLQPNSLIFKINGEYVTDAEHFAAAMNEKSPGDVVVFTVKEFNEDGSVTEIKDITVTLGEAPSNESRAFIGIFYSGGPLNIGLLGISVGVFNSAGYLEFLKTLPSMLYSFDISNPRESVSTIWGAWLLVMMMPFLSVLGEGFGGFSGTMMQFFEPVGWAEPLGIGIFWIANLLYWIAWLNFYVGLFNCLPALPLDGGHMFRTYFVKIAEKLKMNSKRAVRLSFRVTTYMTAFIFLSFVMMFTWPHIGSFVLGLFG